MNISKTRILRALVYRTARLFPDRLYLKMLFPLRTGYRLNLDHPQTFNEKLQWLKLYNRRPEYTKMVDKVEAKKYVAGIIGGEHIIPTLAVYDSAEDIDFDALPNQFVLKCTHDSGGIVVCRDKAKLDRKAAIKKLSHGLKVNYFYQKREWPYKNVKPRIIAEQYMGNDGNSEELIDYKFYCFDGTPKLILVASGRFSNEKSFAYFDLEWNKINITWGAPNPKQYPNKPENYQTMLKFASVLSKGVPHIRVDLYEVNGKVYFGELTFFDGSGMQMITPSEWDYKLGEMIRLPDFQ